MTDERQDRLLELADGAAALGVGMNATDDDVTDQTPSVVVTAATIRDLVAAVRERDVLREGQQFITGRTAMVNHMSGENDACTGDESVTWCQPCWDDAVEWLDPNHSYGSDDEVRAALHSKDGAS